MKRYIRSTFIVVFAVAFALCMILSWSFTKSNADAVCTLPSQGWSETTEDGETVYTRLATHGTVVSVARSEGDNTLTLDFRINTYDSNWYSPVQITYLVGTDNYICAFDAYNNTVTMKKGDELLKSGTVQLEKDKWYSVRLVEEDGGLNVYLGATEEPVLSVSGVDAFVGNKNVTLGGSNVNASFRKVNSFKKAEPKDVIVMPSDGWEKTQSGDDVIISRLATHDTAVELTSIGNANTLDFDMRITRFDANWYSPAIVEYKTATGSVSLRYDKFINKIELYSGENKLVSETLDLTMNEWAKLRFVFDENCLEGYVVQADGNATKVISSRSTGDMLFGTGRVFFKGANVKVDFKNPVSSVTEIEHILGDVDLSFSTPESVKYYTGKGAAVSYDDALKVTLNEVNGGVYSPVFEVNRGTFASAYLPVMNTVVAKIKNNSTADKVKVYFITSEDKTFDDLKFVEYDIEPDSDYRTYYFNLSVNSLAKGYLRGFGFAFNADNGEVSIDEMKFSHEAPYYDYIGNVSECVAANDKITVKGAVSSIYNGETVTVYETPVQNYLEDLSFKGVKALGTAKVSGGTFEVVFDQGEGTDSRLATYFIAAINGKKVSKRFLVTNYDDFAQNPYAFTLKNYTVDVTVSPYNATGDGFTDDTTAIQAAIDAVSQSGGGKVVLPFGDKTYGNRYVSTGITLKSNVELCIEKGAILLQSPRLTDYKYQVYLGHTNMGKEIAWGLSALMHNPFVFIKDCENVKITGGGEIRMSDNGSECMDANGCVVDGVYYSDNEYTIGCTSNVHMIPIAIYGCDRIEINDVTIRRSNNWHVYVRETSRLYIRDLYEEEANCLNADGIDFSTAVHDVVMERFITYSNDDALALCVCTNDPRDDVSVWRSRSTADDRSLYNFSIRDCNIYGGHGLTFIPWGSDFNDASKVEIRDIRVENCHLNGAWNDIGSWSDNPFYGTSNYYSGTYGFAEAAESDDYSPIRDITIINNVYGNWSTFNGIKVTGLITDADLEGAKDLQNANFDKVVKFDGEENFVTGTSYWSRTGVVGTEKAFDGYGYSAFIQGNGSLSQGVFRIGGEHSFGFEYVLTTGSAKAFAKDLVTGKIIAEKELNGADEFTAEELKFSIERNMQVSVGIEYVGEGKIYLDNTSLILGKGTAYEIDGAELAIEFDSDEDYLGNFANYSVKDGVSVENGCLYVDKETEYKLMLKGVAVTNMSLSVKIAPMREDGELNSGVIVNATGKLSSGFITSLNVHVEKAIGAEEYIVSIYSFDNAKGYLGKIAVSGNVKYNGVYVLLKTVIKDGWIYVFTDGADMPVISREISEIKASGVGLRTWLCDTYFDDFTLVAKELAPKAGDRTKLDALLAFVKGLDKKDYTPETYATLTEKIAEAETLSTEATQREVNAVYGVLYDAMISLTRIATTDDSASCSAGLGGSNAVALLALFTVAVIIIRKKSRS